MEVDTLDVKHLLDVMLKHFTARDAISRWDVLEVHTSASSHTAAAFMDILLRWMPFPIKVIGWIGELSLKMPLRRNSKRGA